MGSAKSAVSSGDLVALFEATWTEAQITSHFAARDAVDRITASAFQEIARRVRDENTHEHEIQQWFLEAFRREQLITEDAPVVAVNRNSGNPHYEPRAETSAPIHEGDCVLLDVWAKKNTPDAVYYDITWMGFVGKAASGRVQQIFEIVRDARDLGVKTVQDSIAADKAIAGWEVDRAVREHIKSYRIWRIFYSSHRAFDRDRSTWRRHKHGRLGNSR